MAVLFPALSGAQTGQPVKPYIVFVMDVSGSMSAATGFGAPSCGGSDTRFDHAKCAVQTIVNSYGDMVMALARFRQSSTDTNCSNGCTITSVDCQPCSQNNNCTPLMSSGDRFELLVPLVNNNEADILQWVSFTCGTCTTDRASDPELAMNGWTPIAGSLRGAKRYFEGLDTPGVDPAVGQQPYWTGPGSDPIRNDPLKDLFVAGSQCRPYLVVQLTDGDETCTQFVNTEAAAASLLTTDVDGRTYRVETKPIGFGQTPPDNQIERLAHAGGNPGDGLGGNLEGFYAQNEEDLSIALGQIIAGALKFEQCNGQDDDCDIQIDEDFPAKNTACDDGNLGICRGTGRYQCAADQRGVQCVIDAPGQPARVETCNHLDDDCDGWIDEAPADCTGCTGVEICDNLDNDCDGQVDELLTRPCGTDLGECTAGTETCSAGTWGNCTGQGPTPEVCDGKDNNCDGTRDGFVEACSVLPGGNPARGLCQPGTRLCPSDGSRTWGPCLNEIVPQAESCDGQDNDCDGRTDEQTGGADCSSDCGIGTTECENGRIVCRGSNTPMPEKCNGFDDDCDRITDEHVTDLPTTPCTIAGQCQGTWQCIGGAPQCVGQGPTPELCDCADNDCDGQIDEGTLCTGGASCVQCQCAFPCTGGEFDCPAGRVCSPGGFCLRDPCSAVVCPRDQNGDQTECVDGRCVRSCDLKTCPGNSVCRGSDGSCQPDNCLGFPARCAANQLCVGGLCQPDPCENITCAGANEYCLAGQCTVSCGDVRCRVGQRCVLGVCQADPCGRPCGAGKFCDETSGTCKNSLCGAQPCPFGLACEPRTGQCVTDPCLGVTCPRAHEICAQGSCYHPDQVSGDGHTYVAPAGGGCAAAATENGMGTGTGGLAALVLLWALGRARVRTKGRR